MTRRATLLCALLLAGCPKRDPAPVTPPPAPSPGPAGPVSDGGKHHTERFAEVAWKPDGTFRYCSVRGKPIKCMTIAKAGDAPQPAPDADASFAIDRSPPSSATGNCKVAFDDAGGDPGAPPAKASLRGPAGTQPIDEWHPAQTDNGDFFLVETSFSPDGKWLAVLHVAVGVGIDEQTADVIHAEVRAAPICR